LRKNVGTTVEEGGFSRPPDAIILPGFSRGLTFNSVVVHRESPFPSLSTVWISLINSSVPKRQTGAEAQSIVASTGRLKPPSSTVVPTFFLKL